MDENKDDFNEENEPSVDQESLEPDNEVSFQISPIAAAFIGLIGGFILYQFVGGTLTLLIFGMDLESAPVNGLRLMTMAGQILFILLPALIFAKVFYSDVGKIIRIRLPEWQEVVLFLIGMIILIPLLQSLLYVQNYFIEILSAKFGFIKSMTDFFNMLNELVEKTYGNLLSAKNILELMLVILVVSVVPALTEETMFRGFVQRSFELKLKPFWAVSITALFFSLYHFNPYGIIPLFLLGAFFGYAAYASKSLVIPMILHFINNFAAIMLFYLAGDDELLDSSASVSHEEVGSYVFMLIGLTVVMIALFIIIKKYYENRKVLTLGR